MSSEEQDQVSEQLEDENLNLEESSSEEILSEYQKMCKEERRIRKRRFTNEIKKDYTFFKLTTINKTYT